MKNGNLVGKFYVHKHNWKKSSLWKDTTGELSGTIEDQVSFYEDNIDNRDFLNLMQQILWDDGNSSIRICYYVRTHGLGDNDWIFANRPFNGLRYSCGFIKSGYPKRVVHVNVRNYVNDLIMFMHNSNY